MRILVLGGTQFVGYHVVGQALARGHEVTLFSRGRTNPGAWPEAEHVRGDRDGGMETLLGRSFDAVIDVCGYVPRVVRQSVEALEECTGRYLFVSTESVYAEMVGRAVTEDSPLAPMPDETTEEITEESYGPLKVLCEREIEQGFGERALIIRPGFVVGPQDHTDRFTYWVRRMARGGEVLAPGDPRRLLQVIDARDLGAWMTSMLEDEQSGVYNANGPALPFEDILSTCEQVTGGDARVEWVSEDFLSAEGVGEEELPLWVPSEGGRRGDLVADSSKATTAGLEYRLLTATVADTLKWDLERPSSEAREGLDPDRERELLERWSRAANQAEEE